MSPKCHLAADEADALQPRPGGLEQPSAGEFRDEVVELDGDLPNLRENFAGSVPKKGKFGTFDVELEQIDLPDPGLLANRVERQRSHDGFLIALIAMSREDASAFEVLPEDELGVSVGGGQRSIDYLSSGRTGKLSGESWIGFDCDAAAPEPVVNLRGKLSAVGPGVYHDGLRVQRGSPDCVAANPKEV